MKLNYYGYYIHDSKTGEQILFDLRPFLATFCEIQSTGFKEKFVQNDENTYLFKSKGDTFLYLMTKSTEIIKKVRAGGVDVCGIHDLLGRDEKLGFASYIYFDAHFFGIACTILAPKIHSFELFINSVFDVLGRGRYMLRSNAMVHHATRDEALKIPFVGKSVVEVTHENSFFQDLTTFIKVNPEDAFDIGSFEITIKPKRNKNIQKAFLKFSEAIPDDDGIKKFMIKAMNTMQDHLTDFYIVGKGSVCDMIQNKEESKICDEIRDKAFSNSILTDKLDEFTKDERFTKEDIEELRVLGKPDAWAPFLPDSQVAD